MAGLGYDPSMRSVASILVLTLFLMLVNAARSDGVNVSVSDETYNPKTAVHHIMYDTAKAEKLLGLKYRSIKQSTHDMVEDFKARGWL